jgi:hypothetical protein
MIILPNTYRAPRLGKTVAAKKSRAGPAGLWPSQGAFSIRATKKKGRALAALGVAGTRWALSW